MTTRASDITVHINSGIPEPSKFSSLCTNTLNNTYSNTIPWSSVEGRSKCNYSTKISSADNFRARVGDKTSDSMFSQNGVFQTSATSLSTMAS
jgi:hypothetical protein